MSIRPLLFRHIAVQSKVDITGIKLIPPHDHLGEVIGPILPSGCANAAVLSKLMEVSYQVLDNHPINCPPGGGEIACQRCVVLG